MQSLTVQEVVIPFIQIRNSNEQTFVYSTNLIAIAGGGGGGGFLLAK